MRLEKVTIKKIEKQFIDGWWHRRRINTEEKAQVVAAVWGTGFICYLPYRTILKNRMNSNLFSNPPGAIHHILQFVLV